RILKANLAAVSTAAALLLPLGSANASTLPDIVKLPTGIDLGGSSFSDGFGRTDAGGVYINFARWNDLTSIRNSDGRKSPAFVDPHIAAFSNTAQLIYISPWGGTDGRLT